MKKNPEFIAIINLAAFGDTVVSSILPKEIMLKFPNAKIIYITSPIGAETAKCCIPEAFDIVIFDKKNINKGFSGILKFLRTFKYWGKIDISIVQSEKRACALLALLIGARVRIGWSSNKRAFLLTHALDKSSEIMKLNVIDYNLRLLRPLGIINPAAETRFLFTKEDEIYINNLINTFNTQNAEFIGLCPCSSSDDRDWLVEEAAEFINLINKNPDLKVVVIGNEKASKFSEQMKSSGTTNFIDLTCKTSISQLGALISRFKFLVTVNTGSMHTAFALKIPTYALFFNEEYKRWGPKNTDNNKVLFNPEIVKAKEVISCINRQGFSNILCH